MFSFCCLLKASPRSDPFWAQASLMWFFRTLPQHSGPDQRNANHPLVSSSSVLVSIVTVVSFYLTGRQLPLKKERWCTRKDRNIRQPKKCPRRAVWRNQTLLDPVAISQRKESPTLELNTSLPRWLGVFVIFPGVVFPKRNPPVQNLGIGGDPWFFFGAIHEIVWSFHVWICFSSAAFFAWINQAPRFRSPSKPHRCVILPPLQVVPVENEAESQGTQQHHCSWSKHKTGSVSTVAPFFCWWLSTTLLVKRRLSCRCDWVLGTLKSLGDSI